MARLVILPNQWPTIFCKDLAPTSDSPNRKPVPQAIPYHSLRLLALAMTFKANSVMRTGGILAQQLHRAFLGR